MGADFSGETALHSVCQTSRGQPGGEAGRGGCATEHARSQTARHLQGATRPGRGWRNTGGVWSRGGELLCSGGSVKISPHGVRQDAGRPERRLPNNAEIQETRGAGDRSGRRITVQSRDGA